MKERVVRALVVLCCVALPALAAAGGEIMQNPPATQPAAAGAPTPPPPPKASLEGTITRAGTGQGLRDAEITLRKSSDVADTTARINALPPQLGALRDLAAAFGGDTAALNSAFRGPVAASGVSDKQGHFVINNVEPGEYIVAVERDGYIRQEYGQRTDASGGAPISLPAGKTTLDFQMVPAGVISGKVTDPDGQAVADARVQAYTYRYSGGKRSMAEVSSAQTNDLGEYRLHPLDAGAYFIAVTPRDGLPTDQLSQTTPSNSPQDAREAQIQALIERGGREAAIIRAIGLGTPPIYYPGSLDPTEATPVNVAVAAEVPAIDFHLRPIRTVKVSGRVDVPFQLPTEAERLEAAQNLQGIAGGGGAFSLGGLGGAVRVSPGGNAAGRGQNPAAGGLNNPAGRGQNPAAGGLNNPAGRGNIQDIFSSLQNAQSVIEPIQVRFARIGAESQSPLASLIGNGPTPVDANGKFQVSNVTPGSYNLTAIARDKTGVEYTARMRVEVGNFDMEGLTIIPRPGVDIKGQIYADSTPPDFKTSQLRVSLTSEDSPNALAMFASIVGADAGGLTARVEQDGSFVLKNVGALPYRVQISGLPAGGYVVAGRYGESDPLGDTFTAGRPETLIQLQVGFSAGNVSANVVDAAGKPAAGILTALVPDEARRGRADLYFSGLSDSAGRVSFANVPPGSYRLYAWEEIPAEAFRYGEFLRRYDDRSVTVTVEKKAAVTAQVKAIPKSDN
ncbi:MAG TPA: carboxypeptidase regulatory-like domain-containing protein [Terriglobia bacterium]|nr:carboxypeptidase regulatory-like domain-containing protein [Terriglobia bacterium]